MWIHRLARAAPGLGAFCIGGLSVGMAASCSSSAPPEHDGTVRSALDQTVTFSVALAVGTNPPRVAVGAKGNLSFDDGVTIVDATGHTTVANDAVAGGCSSCATQFGVATVVGDEPSHTTVNVVSTAPVRLAPFAEVTGTLLTTVAPSEQIGAVVDGALTVDPHLHLTDEKWRVTFPATTNGNVTVWPRTKRTLTPGAYGNVTVFSGGKLTLGAGTYTFASLDVEPLALVQSDTTNAPLVLYALNTLILHGPITTTGGAAKLLLGYAGTSAVTVDGLFSGTLVAPNASLTLGALVAPTHHSGAFFGQSVEVRPLTQVVHVPFADWFDAIPLRGPTVLPTPSLSGIPAAVPPPPLGAPADVPAFLQWAYQSRPSQIDAARAIILGAAGNENIAAAIVNIVSADNDLGRNLVGISVLGELRTQAGLQFFVGLLNTPLPTTGTFVDGFGQGAPVEALELAKMQARAIDGLAMMLTSASDAAILSAISTTTSNLVRARGVHDYLWVHGDAGRAVVAPLLPPDQQIFLDRFDVAGASGTYDTRLAAYLAKHPEVVPAPIPIQTDQ